MRISDWSSDVCSSDLVTKKRDEFHKCVKPPREFPDERPLSCRIWSVSGRAGSLPLSSPPVRAGEPSGRRRRRMGSGTTELVVRPGGYGAVLQTGPVSGFGSCVTDDRKCAG